MKLLYEKFKSDLKLLCIIQDNIVSEPKIELCIINDKINFKSINIILFYKSKRSLA